MSRRISHKLQRLDDFLLSLNVDDDAMLLAELDGFLAGIAVCPDLIPPSEWMPMIWGEDEPVFENERHAKDIIGLVMRHYNDVSRGLGRGSYEPIYDFDTDGTVFWETWIDGFIQAMRLRPDAWMEPGAEDDEDVMQAVFVLSRLGILATVPVNEIEPMEVDELLREAAGDVISHYVEILNKARLAGVSSRAHDQPEPFVKVGRNDSCPCGSGKKYKKCCLN